MLNKISNEKDRLNRIAIIGCGHVGSTSAYSLLTSGAAEEIVLIDEDKQKLRGQAMDLQHTVPLTHPTRIWAGNYDDAATADIAVIAAGASSKPGETRLDLLGRNAAVIHEIMKDLKNSGFAGVTLMTTNPVDILAQIAQDESGFRVEKVIGSGTVLDTARLRNFLSEELKIDARSIHAYIVGEHGNSEIAAWSSARAGGVPIEKLCQPARADFDDLLQKVRDAAPEIVRHKGYTSFAIASSVTKICEAILRDEHRILPVSTMTDGQYGIEGVYLSLPSVLGRGGVEKVIELPLDEDEQKGLRASADVLRRTLENLKREAAYSADRG